MIPDEPLSAEQNAFPIEERDGPGDSDPRVNAHDTEDRYNIFPVEHARENFLADQADVEDRNQCKP